jgi:hypothetical protein
MVPYLPAATAYATTGDPLLSAAALGGFGLVARMYESAAARNILTRLPRVRVGSEEETKLINRMGTILQDQARNAGNMQ